MSSNFVDRHSARERDSSFKLLALLVAEHLSELLSDEIINSSANGGDVSAVNSESNGLLEGSINDNCSSLVLVKNSGLLHE